MSNIEVELWKDVVGYEGYYKVSNFGNIKSLLFSSNATKRKHYREKILKQKVSKDNTCRVSLWKDGVERTWLVHRIVAYAFLGESNLTVNHKDGNRLNNNLTNLEWMTREENIKHGFENDLYSSQKKIILKSNSECIRFRSMAEASRFLGKNDGYISGLLKKGKTTTGEYLIEIAQFDMDCVFFTFLLKNNRNIVALCRIV